MPIGILITDGGPHPADKWAECTASHIVSIADHVAGERRGSALKLQAAVIDILERRHTTVQTGERGKSGEHGHARLGHDLDPEHHVVLDEVVAEIVAAAQGTPWAAEFAQPATADALRQLIGQHFSTSIHIERSWHADRNPEIPEAAAFRTTYHPEG